MARLLLMARLLPAFLPADLAAHDPAAARVAHGRGTRTRPLARPPSLLRRPCLPSR